MCSPAYHFSTGAPDPRRDARRRRDRPSPARQRRSSRWALRAAHRSGIVKKTWGKRAARKFLRGEVDELSVDPRLEAALPLRAMPEHIVDVGASQMRKSSQGGSVNTVE